MKNVLSRAAVGITIFIAVVACSTPYQETGLLGGVSATQIDATTIRISGRGNGFTDSSKINDYVMLKAAEETLRHGYDLFLILRDADTSRTESFSVPETHTTFSPTVGSAWVPGAPPVPVFGSSIQTYTTESETTFRKPGEDITIRMLSGPKPMDAPTNLFVAGEVVLYLSPRVRPSSDEHALSSTVPALLAPQAAAAYSPPLPAVSDLQAPVPPAPAFRRYDQVQGQKGP